MLARGESRKTKHCTHGKLVTTSQFKAHTDFSITLFSFFIFQFIMLEAEEEKRRFQIELEFIQCLSNPWYLNSKVSFFVRAHLVQRMMDSEIE